MSPNTKKFICIHGHFYQPPRENPWLQAVEVQDSAAPYHDWNERITAECYAPNAAARVLGSGGTIVDIVNNYRSISFNFGPTLLSWLENKSPRVHQALVDADRDSLKRLGRGNALAQVYNHIIMPLASRRDKLTQVRWGLGDFQMRFGRRPEGMWLAETAVDTETLECLAAEGILFTILAPDQAAQVRPDGDEAWQPVNNGGVDPRRAYRVDLPSGREIAVFFYDGPLSRAIAFEQLLSDGALLARRLIKPFDENPAEPQLVNIATDGESYGHHHRFGEMALAYTLKMINEQPGVELTNYGAFLEANPPSWQARIKENSSWSCPHGVERWRSDCGCALEPGRGWNQKWRGPLRQALNGLNLRLSRQFEDQGGQVFKDPWQARDDYYSLRPHGDSVKWDEFLTRHGRGPLEAEMKVRAAKLLECQRFAMYMFTSCGWFFDDISGLEPVQDMRFAARALQLARELGGEDAEPQLLAELEKASSNKPHKGTGADIWRTMAAPAQVGPERVAGHAAIREVMGEGPLPQSLYCYRLDNQHYHHRHNLGLNLSWGRVTVSHMVLQESHDLVFAALHSGGHDFMALVCGQDQASGIRDLGRDLEQPLRLLETETIKRILQERLPGRRYTLADLFLEGRRSLARTMLAQTTSSQVETARSMYESSRETMLFLRSINVPLPPVYIALTQAIISEGLLAGLAAAGPGPLAPDLGRLAREALDLGLELSSAVLGRALEGALARSLAALEDNPGLPGPLYSAGQVLDLASKLEIEPGLRRSQNKVYRIIAGLSPELPSPGLARLAQRLGLDMEGFGVP